MSSTRIRRLPKHVVNKIAAGEVVERPASVVKELVENSIDAQSSRIEISLEDGGKKYLRVVDDGVGMSPADLALAFESHATSKIVDTDDLFEIDTLGFRGEALPSIASISRCRIVSRERGADEGASIECVGGKLAEVRACGAPEGTLFEVRNLFFNTPARLKFLRTTATELRHAVQAVTRLALPHTALDISLTHNKRSVLRLPASDSLRERIGAVFAEDMAGRLLPARAESSAMTVTGMISPPGQGMASNLQYVFLNGRYIRDRSIGRAIIEAYRGRLARGRFPAVILNLQLDPRRVDVNVHPTKIEVRFRDQGAVFAQVLSALETALRAAGTPLAKPAPAPHRAGADRRESVRQAIVNFLDREPPKQDGPRAGAPRVAPVESRATEPQTAVPRPPAAPREQPPTPVPAPPAGPLRSYCQIHDTYIVEETDEGFLLIDQHALHERILYEELRRRVARAAVPRQRLLVPEIIDLAPADFARIMELKEQLLKMGLEVEPFGERTIAVQAVPHLAGDAGPRELLLDIVREIRETPAGRPGQREEQLMRVIACKTAIKAGERLTRSQIEALLEQRARIGPEPVCPHGRPTTVEFDLPHIERQFHRR